MPTGQEYIQYRIKALGLWEVGGLLRPREGDCNWSADQPPRVGASITFVRAPPRGHCTSPPNNVDVVLAAVEAIPDRIHRTTQTICTARQSHTCRDSKGFFQTMGKPQKKY